MAAPTSVPISAATLVRTPAPTPARTSASRIAAAGALLVAYGAVVVWLTWPIAAHVSTHLPAFHRPNLFDVYFVGWALAWESHALTTHPSQLLNANIYHPASHALCYGPMGFGTLPWFLPTFLASGNPTLALNLVWLVSTALTAWALHLVVVRLTGSHLGGFIAAWTLLMSRWALWDGPPVSTNWAVVQYFPLIALLAAAPERRFRGLACLAALIVLQGLVDVYIAAALLGPLGVLALLRLARRRTRRAGLRLVGVLAVACIVLLGAYAGLLVVRAENPDLARQTVWVIRYPAVVLPLGLLGNLQPTAVPPAVLALIAAGAVALLVGIGGRSPRTRRAWAVGALWAVVGTYQSLGPVAVWRGRPVRLPQGWLAQWVPIYQALREPSRLGIAGLIGLALLAGVAFAQCTRWARRENGFRLPAAVGATALAAALAAVMYGTYRDGTSLPIPRYMRTRLPPSYPIVAADFSDPPLLARLRERDGPLLELPIGAGGLSPPEHSAAMYRSIFHWRPLLNGYGSYWPAGFRERMDLALRLPDRDAVAALRQEAGLDTILVHTAMFGPDRIAWDTLAANGGRDDLRFVARDGGDLLFQVAP